MMEQVNCSNCMVCDFKEDLCTSEICDRFRKRGDSDDFESLLLKRINHGRWEYIGGYGYQYRCSKCFMCAGYKTNYCPNCGALMDGGEE